MFLFPRLLIITAFLYILFFSSTRTHALCMLYLFLLDFNLRASQAARASVESTLEKDAALQARTIDAAVKSLRDGG